MTSDDDTTRPGASGPRKGGGLTAAFAAVLAGLFGQPGGASADALGATLSAEEALEKARAGEVILVDIRTPAEWRATGAPEPAVLADMQSRQFGETLLAALEGDRGKPIAVICRSGRRSAMVARQLKSAGFSAVYDVPEGMSGSGAGPGWLARGLPLRPAP